MNIHYNEMELLLSTTTINHPDAFREYKQGVKELYEQINTPSFNLREAHESFWNDPADSHFQQGYFDAVSHELEKQQERDFLTHTFEGELS